MAPYAFCSCFGRVGYPKIDTRACGCQIHNSEVSLEISYRMCITRLDIIKSLPSAMR
jgi:hypothetical protein